MAMPDPSQALKAPRPRLIHLLYVPTIFCNLGCQYCYLGTQTDERMLADDKSRALKTLTYALDAFRAKDIYPFNVSLHGGEVTTLPPQILEQLFALIRSYYLEHLDLFQSEGFNKSVPHIKTNLYNFHKYEEVLRRHQVSISGSVDLPLSLHAKYRCTKNQRSTLQRTIDNIRLLGQYPFKKKLSATLFDEHLQHTDELIDDIWRIHRELGFDMNQFNFMFGFESALNESKFSQSQKLETAAVRDDRQVEFYRAMREAFVGTELEFGFRRHWFDEFTPSYCTSARNCGERFFLLQSNGKVYSCVRGQGYAPFYYGNIFEQSVEQILLAGKRSILQTHQEFGFDEDCQRCEYLHLCHTGCAFVKREKKQGKSYTCALQKEIYRDNPMQYKPLPTAEHQQVVARNYAFSVHPKKVFEDGPTGPKASPKEVNVPNELFQDKNALARLIEKDPILGQLYTPDGFVLEVGGELQPLQSQILKRARTLLYLCADDELRLHVRRSLFSAHCPEPVRNTLYLQMLRDTLVVYGEEKREKQEHLFTHQIFYNMLAPSPRLGDEWICYDLRPLLLLHQSMFLPEVSCNFFVTTGYLRDYHYQRQKQNAFYHIQAINLPFQNIEFYWDTEEEDAISSDGSQADPQDRQQ